MNLPQKNRTLHETSTENIKLFPQRKKPAPGDAVCNKLDFTQDFKRHSNSKILQRTIFMNKIAGMSNFAG